MTELLGLAYSPWTEKARFALDARRVPYRFRHYQPLLGEPALRLKLRRLTGRVTVPVLTTDDGRLLGDSALIARWADERGEGPTLFPRQHDAAIQRFIDLSERGEAAGRALSLRRMREDDAALAEMVPRKLRERLGRLAIPIAAFGIDRTLRKYEGHREGPEGHHRVLVGVLDELRAALARAPSEDGKPTEDGKPKTLFGSLTFADIAMAQVLVSVDPPASGLELGEASRRSFTEPGLRDRYADLIAWRDALYRTYR
jgi:glutathione S-transferase